MGSEMYLLGNLFFLKIPF